jgi:hypothetical protein
VALILAIAAALFGMGMMVRALSASEVIWTMPSH